MLVCFGSLVPSDGAREVDVVGERVAVELSWMEAVWRAARCRVSVLVSVRVLVDVVVVKSSATAASGRRMAARIVGRCIVRE